MRSTRRIGKWLIKKMLSNKRLFSTVKNDYLNDLSYWMLFLNFYLIHSYSITFEGHYKIDWQLCKATFKIFAKLGTKTQSISSSLISTIHLPTTNLSAATPLKHQRH
jgi:hypothetical protein